MAEESKLVDKLENQQKFTEEEMNQVKEIQNEYFKIQDGFGLLTMNKIRIEEENEAIHKHEELLREKYKENKDKETKFLEETTKKYGEGSLNSETGVFTKNNSK